MSRLKFLLAILFLAVIALPLHSQVAYPNGLRNPMPESPSSLPPPKAWKAATHPDPTFPLRVKLTFDSGRNGYGYNGMSYYGRGKAEVRGPQAANLNFRYNCDLSLGHLGALPARWITPGSKLEVLLQNGDATRTRTCRISVHS